MQKYLEHQKTLSLTQQEIDTICTDAQQSIATVMKPRVSKLEQNKRLVSETEEKVIQILKDSTLQLSDRQGKYEFAFRDGPQLQVEGEEGVEHFEPDFEFPLKDVLSYDNHIIGFVQKKGSLGINVIMSNGKQSDLPLNAYQGAGYTEVRINPPTAEVRKVIQWGNLEFAGVQFFDKDGKMILEAGRISGAQKEIDLAEGERLIGMKSKKREKTFLPRQYSLVFIIGALE